MELAGKSNIVVGSCFLDVQAAAGESWMKVAVLGTFIIAASAVFSSVCLAGAVRIEREVILSAPHPMRALAILPANDGDLLILGTTDEVGSRAWATRISPEGQPRWDYLGPASEVFRGRPINDQRFVGAIELPNKQILLCGHMPANNGRTAVLVRLGPDGSVISETEVPAIKDNSVITVYSCHKTPDGILLVGSASGFPAGTGWMVKLNWDLEVLWIRFSDDYGTGNYIDAPDHISAVGWHAQDFFVEKTAFDGSLVAKKLLPINVTPNLVQGSVGDPNVYIALFDSNDLTEIWTFDDKLRGPTRKLRLHNVGVKKAIELPDRSILLLGSKNIGFLAPIPVAAFTHVSVDGSYKTSVVGAQGQSLWYDDGVLITNGTEVAAIRRGAVEPGENGQPGRLQTIVDWIGL